MKRVVDGSPNSPRQVDIGGRDDKCVRLLHVDRHDAVERMLLFLSLLQVARQIDNLLLVLPDRGTLERNDAGRVFVVDAVTGLAQLLVSVGRGSSIHCQRPS